MLVARAIGDEAARGVQVIHVTKPAHLVARHIHQGADPNAPRRFLNLNMVHLASMIRPSPGENALSPETAQPDAVLPGFSVFGPKLHLITR